MASYIGALTYFPSKGDIPDSFPVSGLTNFHFNESFISASLTPDAINSSLVNIALLGPTLRLLFISFINFKV